MSRKRNKRSRGKPRPLATADFLRSTVERNRAAEVEKRRGGGCRVSVPMRRPRWMVPPISWLLPFSSHRRVELDRLGAEVLAACNGRRTVEEMIEKFAADHKLSFREAQVSVTTFIRQLVERGLVAVVGPEQDAPKR
jgi:hypothetical protein